MRPIDNRKMIHLLLNELRAKETVDVIDSYLKQTKYPTKWILLTDYCLDAQNKSNVITFVLLHYKNENEYSLLEHNILKLQKSDIKHTRFISNQLMRYLKKIPIFSFSFILDDRDQLFGSSISKQQTTIINNLSEIKNHFQNWLSTAPNIDITNYYNETISKIDSVIYEVSKGKRIKLIEDILLATFFGSIYTAEILRKIPELEIIGWFPDRDKITQSYDGIAIPIFQSMLHNNLGGKDIKFPVAQPNIIGTPFYDALNRIPDDICAAIADYNFSYPSISKEKFSHVLHVLMSGNPYVRVYRIYRDANNFHLSTQYYKTTLQMTIKFYLLTMKRDVTGFMKRCKKIIFK